VTVEDQHGAQIELLCFSRTYSLVAPMIAEDNIVLAQAEVSIRDDRTSLFCNDLKPAELSAGSGAGVPLRLRMRVDQCTPDNMDRLKTVLHNNEGDSDVYLTLTDGAEELQYMLPSTLRVTRSSSLMGDLKATTWAGILG
ncbi:MAG: DNA polymerase III subunit alpha, partial [Mycobacteriaceae bacterium]